MGTRKKRNRAHDERAGPPALGTRQAREVTVDDIKRFGVAIVLLLITRGIARRYLAGMGVPTGWLSIPRILRTCFRVFAATVSGVWRAGRGTARFIQKRRRIRRRPVRASIGNLR
jgi:uncharacterized membrane protein